MVKLFLGSIFLVLNIVINQSFFVHYFPYFMSFFSFGTDKELLVSIWSLDLPKLKIKSIGHLDTPDLDVMFIMW